MVGMECLINPDAIEENWMIGDEISWSYSQRQIRTMHDYIDNFDHVLNMKVE
jgi:hypothetical protein